MLSRLAGLVRELGHFPVVSELKLKTRRDKDFPNPKTLFARFGNKESTILRLRKFCEERGELDLLALLPVSDAPRDAEDDEPVTELGFVHSTPGESEARPRNQDRRPRSGSKDIGTGGSGIGD
jgi:hypothetical protein